MSSSSNFIAWKTSKGLVSYPDALSFMAHKVEQIKNKKETEMVWLLEHPILFSKGRLSKEQDITTTNIPVFETTRGGKVTYHGPGQRVIYAMIDLKKHTLDIKKYIFLLEEWIIQTLRFFSIKGEHRPGRIGVWVTTPEGEKKIAAIGVQVRNWVTSHGVALNICNDLHPYTHIIPCGLKEFGVTSLQELGVNTSLEEVDKVLRKTFIAKSL